MGFVIFSVLFAIAAVLTSFLVRPKAPTNLKKSTYECGIKPKEEAQIKFGVKYYLLAILFIIFEVETIFLFPWAVSIKEFGILALIEALVFIAVLVVGWLYAWRKGFLDYK